MCAEYTFVRSNSSPKGGVLGLAAAPDGYSEFRTGVSFFFYDHGDPPNDRWGDEPLPMWITGISSYRPPETGRFRFCVISAEGDVAFIDDPVHIEKILGTGIWSPDSKRWGRMWGIKGIGKDREALFACGDARQIYQRVGPGEWRNIAPELLQDKTPILERTGFWDVDGVSENDVYVAGQNGALYHWDGSRMEELSSPTRRMLVSIAIKNENSVWISGGRGTLLHGNHRDGFVKMPGISEEHHLNAVALHDGKVYLAAALGPEAGLYVYEHGGMHKVRTGLTPELDGVDYVSAGAGVLWVNNGKDIVRFDGHTWERIDCPTNTPIR